MRSSVLLSATVLSVFFTCTGCAISPVEHIASSTQSQSHSPFDKSWHHGSANCTENRDPVFDVLTVNQDTHVLRQNKCLTFEAPFIFVLEGQDRVLILDTGAIEDPQQAPLVETIMEIRKTFNKNLEKPLLVMHTHSHLDHVNGDAQFTHLDFANIIEPGLKSVKEALDLPNWPEGKAEIDLGKRKLIIIPTPGHHEDAISIYDSQTKVLLTGDSLYPGLIYVRDWEKYKSSMLRLAEFAKNHDVSYIVGTHIEMSATPGQLYEIGSQYQPNEAPLPLPVSDLMALATALETSDKKVELRFDRFVIRPMSMLQKTISNVLSVFF